MFPIAKEKGGYLVYLSLTSGRVVYLLGGNSEDIAPSFFDWVKDGCSTPG
jgi:hypothetical protein